MAQPIEVVSILVAAGDRRHPRHQHSEHLMSDAIRIAPIRHGVRKQPTCSRHTPTERSASRSSRTPVLEDWLPPLKSTVIFLRQTDGRSRGIVGHGGCGAGLIRKALCLDNDLLRESRSWRYSRRKFLRPDEFSGLTTGISADDRKDLARDVA
jgi:hypothetical protein